MQPTGLELRARPAEPLVGHSNEPSFSRRFPGVVWASESCFFLCLASCLCFGGQMLFRIVFVIRYESLRISPRAPPDTCCPAQSAPAHAQSTGSGGQNPEQHRHLCVTVRVRLVSVLRVGLGWTAALAGWRLNVSCRVGVVAWEIPYRPACRPQRPKDPRRLFSHLE